MAERPSPLSISLFLSHSCALSLSHGRVLGVRERGGTLRVLSRRRATCYKCTLHPDAKVRPLTYLGAVETAEALREWDRPRQHGSHLSSSDGDGLPLSANFSLAFPTLSYPALFCPTLTFYTLAQRDAKLTQPRTTERYKVRDVVARVTTAASLEFEKSFPNSLAIEMSTRKKNIVFKGTRVGCLC